MTLKLTSATLSLNGADLTGFAKDVGVELDPWQAEVLERAIEQRPGGFPERHTWRVEFRARKAGRGLRQLFGPILDEVPGPVASWRKPWSLEVWMARRAAGFGPQRVEVHQDRVDVVFTATVAWS